MANLSDTLSPIFFLSNISGLTIPSKFAIYTPLDLVLYYKAYIKDTKNIYEGDEMAKAVIEVLESESCAKCVGLKYRVQEVLEELKDKDIEVRYLDLFEDQDRIVELGMYTSPSLAINGELHFVGKIPSKEELKSLILEKLGEK